MSEELELEAHRSSRAADFLRVATAVTVFGAVIVMAIFLPRIIRGGSAAEAAREGVTAVRRNNAVNACRASISNSLVQPKVDAALASALALVSLNTEIDLATRLNHLDLGPLAAQYAAAKAALVESQAALAAARASYQTQIKQSAARPDAFVATCKRHGLLDQDS